MADPFLLSHSCAPLQYTIAGALTPVSIRDQMIRAKMFVDRAVEQAQISGRRPLLVVGAGAGGVTAAMRAAQLQIPVTLLEASHQAFGRQKKSSSRWIDPTQYDWPVDHWARGIFPWDWPSMPLPWAAQISSVIAGVWDREFRRAQARYGHLQTLFNSTPTSIVHRPSNDLEVRIATPAGPLPGPPLVCGAALHCLGFGVEKSSLGTYSGFEFWDADPLEKPSLGLPPRRDAYRVLIAGGGDGALQDFLRIATGLKSAREILMRFPRPAQEAVAAAVYSAEDQAQRAGIWCERQHEHAVFGRLQYIHQLQVQKLNATIPTFTGLTKALGALLQHARPLEIVLAHPCDHFSRCYGMNRFLTLMILDYAEAVGLPIRAVPATGTFSVMGVSHVCSGNARACHGEEHEVRFQEFKLCAGKPSGVIPGPPSIFDAVVLRLGVTPPAPFASTVPLLVTRQILPYRASQ